MEVKWIGIISGVIVVILVLLISRKYRLKESHKKTFTIVCGLQGTGKTTAAKLIAKRQKAFLLQTDVIRKELSAKPKYTGEEMKRIYDEMYLRAVKQAGRKNVVLDATFNKRESRIRAREIADRANASFQIIEIISKPEVVRQRLEVRSGDESDADWEVYQRAKDRFEPIKEHHITIDNSGSLEELVRNISLLQF